MGSALPLPSVATITDLIKKGMTIEAQEQIVKLREAAIEQKEENIELKEQIAELKKKADIQDRLIWEKPYYFLRDGDKREGPFCQLCWDKERKLIRLQGGGQDFWLCQCCKNCVTDEKYVSPVPRPSKYNALSRRSSTYSDGI